MSNLPDVSPQQNPASRFESTPTESIVKSFRQTWDFNTTALTEYTDRSKAYKLMNVVSLLAFIISIVIAVLTGWWLLPLACAVLLQCCLFYTLHAARLYHERTVNNLSTSHQSETKQLHEKYDAAIQQVEEMKGQLQDRTDKEKAVKELLALYNQGKEICATPSNEVYDNTKPHAWVASGTVIIRDLLGDFCATEFRDRNAPMISVAGEHSLQPRLDLLMNYMRRLEGVKPSP